MATYGSLAIHKMWVAFRDDDGYAMGSLTTPNSPSNGTMYGAHVVDNAATVTFGADVTPQLKFVAGGALQATASIGATDIEATTVELNGMDETLMAFINRSTIDTTTNTAATIMHRNINNRITPPMIIGFNIVVHNFDTAQNEYLTVVFLNAQLQLNTLASAGSPTGDATNPNNITLTVLPSKSTRGATGALLSSYGTGVIGGQDVLEIWRGSNPRYVATYVDDGTAGSFILPYRPTNSDATGSAQNHITVNGSAGSATSVSTTTATVTRTAGTAGDIVQLFYETEYVAP
ncbi:MAG: hypothetical protein D6712_15205 [Chloroflexi bacterium]|nr:MAG: hypothetical protein D6712_15205 [Chloroflexota bacterium]